MKRSPMLKDGQSQYCKISYITKNNWYQNYQNYQCSCHQNCNDIHHRDSKVNSKVHVKKRKSMNSQGNTGQKEQHWRYHNTRLQTIL
jgi:hypothetical protein